MELYILLAIIWAVGVIWSAIFRVATVTVFAARNVRFTIGPSQAVKAFIYDFFWFIRLPWVGLKSLFKGV
jgi:hypothetical protein